MRSQGCNGSSEVDEMIAFGYLSLHHFLLIKRGQQKTSSPLFDARKEVFGCPVWS